jgi:hypothetical protein
MLPCDRRRSDVFTVPVAACHRWRGQHVSLVLLRHLFWNWYWLDWEIVDRGQLRAKGLKDPSLTKLLLGLFPWPRRRR